MSLRLSHAQSLTFPLLSKTLPLSLPFSTAGLSDMLEVGRANRDAVGKWEDREAWTLRSVGDVACPTSPVYTCHPRPLRRSGGGGRSNVSRHHGSYIRSYP